MDYLFAKALLVLFVYGPSILLSSCVGLYHLYNLEETRFWRWFGIGLGVFTVLYALLLLAP